MRDWPDLQLIEVDVGFEGGKEVVELGLTEEELGVNDRLELDVGEPFLSALIQYVTESDRMIGKAWLASDCEFAQTCHGISQASTEYKYAYIQVVLQ